MSAVECESSVDPDIVGSCADCTCALIRQRAWGKATTNQRRTWLAQGQRMLQGHGLCRGCYLRAYKAGEFPKRPAAVSNPRPLRRPCVRCGVQATAELCDDCTAVMDRDELALWSA